MNKNRKFTGLLLALVLALTLCFGCSSPETETPAQIIKDITAEEAGELILENEGNPGFMIIDVRTPSEYAEGHIENSVLVDFNAGDFEQKIGEFDRDGKYLVYCRSGNRSGQAVDYMRERGFKEVYNMLGGIGAWTAAGFPTVK
jgi:rhodanese-related sulfurtransferase